MKFNIDRPVMVTGATGYVAGWLVKGLLEEGFCVHAPVRDAGNPEKTRLLSQLAESLPGTIRFFEADLLRPGSYEEAMIDCQVVFHTASPFINKVSDPLKDLVEPALKGTQNVLEAVNRNQSVGRVVLTSSVAAIIGDAADLLALPEGLANEDHWNVSSSLEHQAYSYSKTLAEREAWKIAEEQDRWKLVVVNPSLVVGPGLNPFASSESFNIVRQLAGPAMKLGAPAFEIGLVDVRDVADAHQRAAFKPEAKGRHIVSARSLSLLEIAQILKKEFGASFSFPNRELPKWLVWLTAPTVGVKRKMVSRNMGFSWKVDHSKSIRELEIKYRPVEKAIIEMFRQMVETGQVIAKAP